MLKRLLFCCKCPASFWIIIFITFFPKETAGQMQQTAAILASNLLYRPTECVMDLD